MFFDLRQFLPYHQLVVIMSSDQQPQPQILEVEDVEQRQKRLRMYLCFLIPRFSP